MWMEILKNKISKKKAIKFPKSFKALPDEAIDILSPEKKMNRIFGKSLRIRQVDAGSCNACEWECIALTNPIYDVQRFGVDIVASPRHADVLLAAGPVSRQMELALKKTYLAMPEPKLVIACGDCAIDGGVYKGSYATRDGVSNVLPVDCHIHGCPPTPATIIKGLLKLIKSISG
ncbi:MAG: NADH dehydrogenase subunit G [Candidatus Scalindua rubra]|uniref:NADH dehydrogenase subunit G n=1 Tax=Candidatus Scalindua rubra TaxID=1872076 RepID=A0A1E3XF16_9BACT|nr:MAG: NADH dehydrogenase subunit G [Candidatus Scalindua rubra]